MLLSSANDASVAVAVEIAGSTESFAALMNDKALEMGLVNTHFTNPHGLDDKEHYTTARELAIITAYAMKNPIFKEIVSSYTKEITSEDGQKRLLVNHNRLLKSIDGCVGVKTGYTKRSGRSLVSAVERDGQMLVCVTINDPDDWRDHKRLIEYGFEMLNAE
jgi:D-alanyl-D-alanine carboxypeptidase